MFASYLLTLSGALLELFPPKNATVAGKSKTLREVIVNAKD